MKLIDKFERFLSVGYVIEGFEMLMYVEWWF